MNWNEQYPKTAVPAPAQIDAYIGSPLREALCSHLEMTYGVSPVVEHSICSCAPGWNVKYKKSGRSLCTLYPAEGCFTAMVTVDRREDRCFRDLLFVPLLPHFYTLYDMRIKLKRRHED